MHTKAIKYLNSLIKVDTSNILMHMVCNLLRKAIIVPKEDDSHFWADVSINTGDIIIRYNPNKVNPTIDGENFRDKFGIRQLAFLLAHEACHVLYGDFEDKTKDPRLLNIAQDARINPTLIEPDFATVENDLSPCLGIQKGYGIAGVFDVHDRNYTVEEIYELLQKYQKHNLSKNGEGGGEGSSQNSENSNGSNQDSDNENNNNGNTSSKSNSSTNTNSSSKSDNDTSSSEELMCGCMNLDSIKIINKDSDESNEEVEADINRLTENIAEDVATKLGISVDTVLGVLKKNKPRAKDKSKWERVIRKYVQGAGSKSSSRYRTYSRPNKRIEMLPGYKTLRYRGISVFLDVSGSMSTEMQNAVDNISVITQFNNGISLFIGWDTELKFEKRNVSSKQVHNLLENLSCGSTDLLDGLKYMVKKCPKDDVIVIISDLGTCNWDEFRKYLLDLAKHRTVVIGLPKYHSDAVNTLSKVTIVYLD